MTDANTVCMKATPPVFTGQQSNKPSSGGASSSSSQQQQQQCAISAFFSCSNHVRRLALSTFDKFTSPVPKAPLPKYSDRLVQLSEGRGPFTFGSISEQNEWLASTIAGTLTTGVTCTAFLKALMLLHDVLVQGAPEFVDAFRPYVEKGYNYPQQQQGTGSDAAIGIFDFMSFRVDRRAAASSKTNHNAPGLEVPRCQASIAAGAPIDPSEEHITAARFFINYVHSLFEFQVRHRPMGNLLKNSSMELITVLSRATAGSVDPHQDPSTMSGGATFAVNNSTTAGFTPAEEIEAANVRTWTPVYRDVAYSCMTLIKYIVAAQTCIPTGCFVSAEIFRRYIVDCCHLYQLTSRVLQHNMLSCRSCKYFTFEDAKKNVACMVQYQRTTSQMNQFFEHLRSLGNDPNTALDLSVLPPHMDALPKAIGEYLAMKQKLMKQHEEVEVETLHSVLSRGGSETNRSSTSAGAAAAAPTGVKQFSSTATDMMESGNHQLLTDSDKSTPLANNSATSSTANPFGAEFQSEALTIDMNRVNADAAASPNAEDPFATAQSFFNEGINMIKTPIDCREHFCPSKFDVQDSTEEDEAVQAERLIQAALAEQNNQQQQQVTPIQIRQQSTVGQQQNNTTFNDGSFVQEPGTAKREVILRDSFSRSQNNNGSETSSDIVETNPAAQRFQVFSDQILGQGGFGTVYKAWDEEEGRHVACKEVKLAMESKTSVVELLKEYRVLTTLEHANIVKVLGFVAHKGHGRIFMEWVPSGSVQSVLQETKKGLRDTIVCRYVREALQGLAFLHSRGIVHRDLKPGNMLLSSEGTVKLTDFGTSRTLEHAAETVQTGTVVGTVPYLAPECVRGTYSAASDIWAVGCTALHMITGKAPWTGEARDNIGLIFKLGSLNDQSVITNLVAGVENAYLREFIMSAMTLERHQRPTATALLAHPFLVAA